MPPASLRSRPAARRAEPSPLPWWGGSVASDARCQCGGSSRVMMAPSLDELGRRAKAAARHLALASTSAKDGALLAGADLLMERSRDLLVANERDVTAAEKAGVTAAVVDRLRLSPARI